jgi:hypothetical protein
MAEKKKIVRLADVGELENILKKDLAEEKAKGKDAFCGGCGAKMKNAGTKAEDLPLPIDEYEYKKGETDNVWTEVQL